MDKEIDSPTPENKDLLPLTAIRTETALSRFPIHRIARKGTVRIELKHQAKALLWRVSHNSEYGQPGPLAYKLDTLVINRRIQEAGRPLPPLLRLGSLREIAEEVGAGIKNTTLVKNALLQNASAFINAKITFKAADRSEKTLEAAFTRYSVIFTGETLPSGVAADAVYLVLNDPYREVLDAAITRPLDYDYMRTLPPAAQRFYEIASYQIYGALLHQNERAKLRYSEYCLLSTATRYLDYDHVKKQMHKVHKPHLQSGYLAKVAYELTTDAEGQPDWFMYYVPGPNAAREYREFTGSVRSTKQQRTRSVRGTDSALELSLSFLEPDTREANLVLSSPQSRRQRAPTNSSADRATRLLVERLVACDLNYDAAERYARDYPEECERQLAFVADLTNEDFESGRGGYLNCAIPGHYGPPKAYLKAKRQAAQVRESHDKEAVAYALRSAERIRKEEIIQNLLSLLATARESRSEEIRVALALFEDYLEAERSRSIQTVTIPRLKQAVEEAWASDEKRSLMFLTYFTDVYPGTDGLPCPIPDLRDFLATNPASECKRLLTS